MLLILIEKQKERKLQEHIFFLSSLAFERGENK